MRLRPLRPQDAPALVAYRSLPEVCRFVPFEPMDPVTIRARIDGDWSRRRLEATGQAIVLGVEDDGEIIGDVTLIRRSEHEAEIGYVINPAHGGRGRATEAARLLCRMAFDELGYDRVVARIVAGNTPSIRLAERLGMRRQDVRREWFKGGWIDDVRYGLDATEWRARHREGEES